MNTKPEMWQEEHNNFARYEADVVDSSWPY